MELWNFLFWTHLILNTSMTSIIIEKSKCCDSWYEIFDNFYQLFKINSAENMQMYLRSIDSWNITRMRRDELKNSKIKRAALFQTRPMALHLAFSRGKTSAKTTLVSVYQLQFGTPRIHLMSLLQIQWNQRHKQWHIQKRWRWWAPLNLLNLLTSIY